MARDPARLLGFGAVDPSSDSALDELERMKSDLGLVGCKLGPIYQDVDPLGPEESSASARRSSGSSCRF